MIATLVAIVVIILDSIIQILIYMRVDYKELMVKDANKNFETNQVWISYQQNDQTKNLNFLLPFYPYFLDCFCKIQISFEGAPLVPKLYTNAKNKHYFVRNLNKAVLYLGIIQAIMGVICVIAYGNKLQEIILMDLYYGVFGNFVKLLYAMGMVVNLVMQLVPILEIMETRQTSIFGNQTK